MAKVTQPAIPKTVLRFSGSRRWTLNWEDWKSIYKGVAVAFAGFLIIWAFKTLAWLDLTSPIQMAFYTTLMSIVVNILRKFATNYSNVRR